MTRILMVCLGNICRSPLAQGILESKLPEDEFFVDSAGTASYHIGSAPDHRSVQVAKLNGIDISYQQARKFKVEDFEKFDIIFAMDQYNENDILHLAKSEAHRQKVKLILNVSSNSSIKDVPDPYYGTLSDFKEVYKLLDNACEMVASNLLNDAAN